jgi:arylsulfatase A-like enzyme
MFRYFTRFGFLSSLISAVLLPPMMLASILLASILLASILLASTLFVSVVAADERPNIIFLMADDQCTYSMGCYGNGDAKTPNLDALARVGMVFDNHYDTTAICMGSRANVMTGMYEYKTGCNFEHGPLRQTHWDKTYPVLLREAGYSTAFAGKFGFEVANIGERTAMPTDDFDWWGGSPGQTSYATKQNKSMARYAEKYPHSTLSYGAFGRDFVAESAKGDKPFCLSISFKAPHRPVSPDPKFDDVYAGKKFVKPQNFGREHGEHFSLQSQQGRQYERFVEWGYRDDYDAVMAKYHQQVYAIDYAVGMIREAIVNAGVERNTVVIYTSDNGFLCGSHGYGSKVLPYEEASRVPLIIHDPRHKNSGQQLRSRALTGNIDFAPTILALAGLDVPKNIDGKNLLPLYEDPKEKVRETLALINVWGPNECHSLSVLTQDWKYIYWGWGEEKFEATEEMYHTAVDPLELKNAAVIPGNQDQLKFLRGEYDKVVAKWKKEAVPYHGYAKFAQIFDRNTSWATKRAAYGTRRPRK